jgi:hypothetical protein
VRSRTQHRPLSEAHELSNAIGSSQTADIGVHAHQEHIHDPALLEKIEYLLAIVGDRVA